MGVSRVKEGGEKHTLLKLPVACQSSKSSYYLIVAVEQNGSLRPNSTDFLDSV
jgi:hypothetical protein